MNIFRALGRRKVSVKLCPRCETPTLKPSSGLDGWLTPQVYICTKCGYRGPIYLEVTPEDVERKPPGEAPNQAGETCEDS